MHAINLPIKRVELSRPSPSIFVANTDTLTSVEGEQEEEETSNVCVQTSPSQESLEASIMARLHCFSLVESE